SIEGCARVEGDEEEDDIDDLENEFDFDGQNEQDMQIPMSPQDEELSEEHHAIVPLNSTMRKEITLLQARPMDPSKDLAAYGYGSVAWKERMEIWKQRQNKLGNMRKEKNDDNEDLDKEVDDDNELPLEDHGSISCNCDREGTGTT
ncbi:cellulose synthase, partial [Trifolium medium]|nr:cellulose synthase [Trifolium medium]